MFRFKSSQILKNGTVIISFFQNYGIWIKFNYIIKNMKQESTETNTFRLIILKSPSTQSTRSTQQSTLGVFPQSTWGTIDIQQILNYNNY